MTSEKEDNALLNKMFESFSKHVNFSDEEKQMITDLSTVVRLKKGDFLLKEGEISNMQNPFHTDPPFRFKLTPHSGDADPQLGTMLSSGRC